MVENYAYVTLLYPNKNGDCTYLDGAILTALGLRKQNIKYPLICMITNDVKQDTIDILKILYDDIKIVDYISPVKKINQITIKSDIFSKEDYTDDENYKEIIKVFTKLHIFNSDLFNFDKILFVDNDIIPINNYETLFNLECPAGWLEHISTKDNLYNRICDMWDDEIKHGELIPTKYTKIYKIPGRSVNSGLLLIKPDKNIFNDMITILKTPTDKWEEIKFPFRGSIGFRKEKLDYYILHDQDFLTQYFENKWHLIDTRYCHWGDSVKYDIYGMHMAGLFYIVNFNKVNAKTWQIQIPINDGFNIISNKTALWGFTNYPQLKNILYKNLQFYINNKKIKIQDIKINDPIYKELNRFQKRIINIIN